MVTSGAFTALVDTGAFTVTSSALARSAPVSRTTPAGKDTVGTALADGVTVGTTVGTADALADGVGVGAGVAAGAADPPEPPEPPELPPVGRAVLTSEMTDIESLSELVT
jgi:hypothetical protein